MRHKLHILLLFLLSSQLSAQIMQKGVVVEMSSGNTPVQGVEIRATGAVPTDSDMNGYFVMNYPSAFPGDPLMRPEAYKQGYEIINDRALRTWNLTDRDTLKIVLGRKDKIDALRRRYHAIGITQMERQYAEIMEKLKKERETDRLSEIDFIHKSDSITSAIVQYKTMLDEYVSRFARINTDDLDDDERKALELVQNGMIREAMAIYEGLDLEGRIQESHMTLAGTNDDIQTLLEPVITKFHLHKELKEYEVCDSLADLIARMASKEDIRSRLIQPEWHAERNSIGPALAGYSSIVTTCQKIADIQAVETSFHNAFGNRNSNPEITRLENLIAERKKFITRKEELLK